MSDVFNNLYKINVNDHTEKKNGLTYLSWSWAWAEIMKCYPDVTYEIVHFDGKPYLYDENLGYMIETKLTIDGKTNCMWLPVMDGANKAMKAQPYTYKTRYGDKEVAAATMTDINKTIMRCLVKNIAMFGLGLYIYAGEDLPADEGKSQPADLQSLASEKDKKIVFALCKEAHKSMKSWMEQIGKPWEELTNGDLASLKSILAGEQK